MRCLTRRALVTLSAFALSFSGSGCAPGKGEVSGKVTYNGAPLNKPNGSIVFSRPGGIQVVAPIATDGTYRTTDVLRGDCKIAVYYLNPKFQDAVAQSKKFPALKEPGMMPHPPIPPFLTPEKYASVDTSGFAVNVESSTIFNVELTGPPIK